MEPLTIYIEKGKEDTIILSKKEFEDLIKRVYENGLEDGKSKSIYAPIIPYPINPYYPQIIYTTNTPLYEKYEITC